MLSWAIVINKFRHLISIKKPLWIQLWIESKCEVLEGGIMEVSVNNGLVNTLRCAEYLRTAQPGLHV